MSEPVTRVEFVLTEEDILQLHQQYLRRFGTNRMRIPLMVLSLLLIPLAMLMDLLGGGQDFSATVCCVGVAVFVMVFFLIIFPLSVRAQSKRVYQASYDYQQPVAMDFYPTVMVTSYRTTRHTVGYDSMVSCCETVSHFCFFENRYTLLGQVLPKSALTAQEVDLLHENLRRVFGKRYLTC